MWKQQSNWKMKWKRCNLSAWKTENCDRKMYCFCHLIVYCEQGTQHPSFEDYMFMWSFLSKYMYINLSKNLHLHYIPVYIYMKISLCRENVFKKRSRTQVEDSCQPLQTLSYMNEACCLPSQILRHTSAHRHRRWLWLLRNISDGQSAKALNSQTDLSHDYCPCCKNPTA